MNSSKAAIVVSRLVSIIQMLAGLFILVMFGISTLMYLVDADIGVDLGISFLIISLVFDALGVMLVIFSIRRSKLIGEYKKYVSIICSKQTNSIAIIASAVGTSPDVVMRKLNLMIQKNYFKNTHINEEMNCIIFGSGTNNQKRAARPEMQTNTEQSQSKSQAQTMQITCKCCGGINKIAKGIVSECDYCGSPING